MLSLSINWLQQNKRLIIITVICTALAINFWAGSRVPSLNDKATLGGALILEDPLGFEAAYPVDPGDPVLERIYYTTINWVLTNRQGMTFGILIAAGFMTLLSLLQRRSFKSHFGNTVLGLFIGMPLGVCVNCAAPIARGLHESGTRLETTLVTMISSPTLNIIVLTMLFSLLPIYMAITKVAMTLFFLLVMVPLLARYVFQDQLVAKNITMPDNSLLGAGSSSNGSCEIMQPEPGWFGAIQWVAKKYTTSLLYIIKLTVPLMLLAGLMGSVAITLFPWQQMVELFIGNQWYMIALGVIVVGVAGLFLPVPIAFDVAIVTALLAAGIPPIFAMTLLFTLGIFSIYSFFIVWTGISKKLALILSGLLLIMGIISGGIVELYLKWDEDRQQELFKEFDLGADSSPVLDFFFGKAWASTTPDTNATKLIDSGIAGIEIAETKMQQPSPAGKQMFSRQYGEDLGLVTESEMPVAYKFMAPFYRNWPVASADVDADGWIDIVFGTDNGLFLYKNIEGKRFERLPLTIADKTIKVMNVALVDLNNDSLPDLYVSLYRRGNFIIINRNGLLLSENRYALPDLGSTTLNATAFGDLDLDGDIDIAAGNWTSGPWTRQPGESSRNAILWNEGKKYKIERLEGFPGETLSMLISDINQDSYPDLMVGNDFQMPEFYYLGQPDGNLKLIKRSDKMFPITSFSTMSIDSGDIDNDLDFEIYATQASGFTSTNPTNRASMLPLRSASASCDEYNGKSQLDKSWKERCLTRIATHKIIFEARQKRDPHHCLNIKDETQKKHCLAYLLLEKSTRFDKNPKLCDQFNQDWNTMAYICRHGHSQPATYSQQQIDETLKQILGRNIFYQQKEDGSYDELAEDMDIDISGWSWTARFADLDNDEWQDIYVVNGQYHSQKRATKVFFKNQQGKRFSNDTREAGLENYLAMSAYTYIDYDNDADLDIIAVSFDGPVWVYTNNTQENRGIIFELDDNKGNRSGIGSRIIIHYGENADKHQIREIKASGGFVSFDAPRAHFGLSEHKSVSRVDVIWSTGERTELKGSFKAGHKYKIKRSVI